MNPQCIFLICGQEYFIKIKFIFCYVFYKVLNNVFKLVILFFLFDCI
jgi:hypothetical protein